MARRLLYVAPGFTLMSAEIKTGSHIEVGVPKPLFKFPPGPGAFRTSKSRQRGMASGSWWSRAEPAGQQAQIMVVLNWAAAEQ